MSFSTFESTDISVCEVPYISAVIFAADRSSESASLNPTVNVFRGVSSDWEARATTIAESNPPLSNAPNGASLTNLLVTALFNKW